MRDDQSEGLAIQTSTSDTPNITIALHLFIDRVEGLRVHSRVCIDEAKNLSPSRSSSAVACRADPAFRDVNYTRAMGGSDFGRCIG
jgi:hypothetical protein